jgi:hypothetical protein
MGNALRACSLAIVAITTLAWSAPAPAYDDGPPDGVAANPPYYFNCTLCHSDHEVNSGNGGILLTGPASFVPGNTYDLTLQLRDPGQARWGFELTVLDQDLQPAGSFTITDPVNTQLSAPGSGLPDFVKQTLTGTFEHTLDGPVSWTFRWTAPSAEAVTFYFAGNAANADDGMEGDYIYADSLAVSEGATAAESGTWSRIKNLYRGR